MCLCRVSVGHGRNLLSEVSVAWPVYFICSLGNSVQTRIYSLSVNSWLEVDIVD